MSGPVPTLTLLTRQPPRSGGGETLTSTVMIPQTFRSGMAILLFYCRHPHPYTLHHQLTLLRSCFGCLFSASQNSLVLFFRVSVAFGGVVINNSAIFISLSGKRFPLLEHWNIPPYHAQPSLHLPFSGNFPTVDTRAICAHRQNISPVKDGPAPRTRAVNEHLRSFKVPREGESPYY